MTEALAGWPEEIMRVRRESESGLARGTRPGELRRDERFLNNLLDLSNKVWYLSLMGFFARKN